MGNKASPKFLSRIAQQSLKENQQVWWILQSMLPLNDFDDFGFGQGRKPMDLRSYGCLQPVIPNNLKSYFRYTKMISTSSAEF